MPTHDAISHYFSGQGVVMIGSRDPLTGKPVGLRPVGNVPDLRITIGTSVLNHKGSQDGQRATDVRLQTELNVAASITLESWNAANLAKALRGDTTEIAAGTVTDEAIIVYPGLVTPLRYIKVSNVDVFQGATELTAYVDEDTPWDYRLNAEAGSIMMNDGSVLAFDAYDPGSPVDVDGVELLVDYAYEAQELVSSLTQPMTDSYLRFEGLNTIEENAPVVVEIFRFSNDPLKELSLISDTIGQAVLEGAVLKDALQLTGSQYFRIKKQG